MNTFAQFPCPHCQHGTTKMINSYNTPKGYRRQRRCLHCNRQFVTYERTAKEMKEDKDVATNIPTGV